MLPQNFFKLYLSCLALYFYLGVWVYHLSSVSRGVSDATENASSLQLESSLHISLSETNKTNDADVKPLVFAGFGQPYLLSHGHKRLLAL